MSDDIVEKCLLVPAEVVNETNIHLNSVKLIRHVSSFHKPATLLYFKFSANLVTDFSKHSGGFQVETINSSN